MTRMPVTSSRTVRTMRSTARCTRAYSGMPRHEITATPMANSGSVLISTMLSRQS